MKKNLKESLIRYFQKEETNIEQEIKKTIEESEPLIQRIVKHYFSGGSYRAAQYTFFIAESTYYKKLNKFFDRLKKRVKTELAKEV